MDYGDDQALVGAGRSLTTAFSSGVAASQIVPLSSSGAPSAQVDHVRADISIDYLTYFLYIFAGPPELRKAGDERASWGKTMWCNTMMV